MRVLLLAALLLVLFGGVCQAAGDDPLMHDAILQDCGISDSGFEAAYRKAAGSLLSDERKSMKSVCKAKGNFPVALELFKDGRWTQAAKRFRAVAYSGEMHMRPYALLRLAECRMRQKQYSAAIELFLGASMASDNELCAWCTLGVARAHLGQGDRPAAMREFIVLVNDYSKTPEAAVARIMMNGLSKK